MTKFQVSYWHHKAEILHWESESKDLARQVETANQDLQSYEQLQPEAVKLSKVKLSILSVKSAILFLIACAFS